MCERRQKKIPFNQLAKAGYNRGINRKRVNKIKRNFHEDMVMPAIVSFRDGKYYIIDHQHQTQAIYELNGCNPNILILCDVREGLTYEQEAELYFRLNTGQAILTFNDLYKGRVEAKEETALIFRDIVESCGYLVDGNTSTSIKALKTAHNIFDKVNGQEKLKTILTLTNTCWPNDAYGVCGQMLEGLSLFLDNHGNEYDQKRFIKIMSEHEPKKILDDGSAMATHSPLKGYTKKYCTYAILFALYNSCLRVNALIQVPPKTR